MTDLPRILKDKQERRDRSAAKPFSEKVKILEKMRDRDRSIRAGRMTSSVQTKPTKKK